MLERLKAALLRRAVVDGGGDDAPSHVDVRQVAAVDGRRGREGEHDGAHHRQLIVEFARLLCVCAHTDDSIRRRSGVSTRVHVCDDMMCAGVRVRCVRVGECVRYVYVLALEGGLKTTHAHAEGHAVHVNVPLRTCRGQRCGEITVPKSFGKNTQTNQQQMIFWKLLNNELTSFPVGGVGCGGTVRSSL